MAEEGKASSMEDEKNLIQMRSYQQKVSKNIVYTYSDFSNDLFAKRLFDQLDIPVYDAHLPSLLIFDFLKLNENDHLSGELVKTYHYPAKDPFGERSSELVITNPDVITDFVLDFFQGKLHPTLPNEDIHGDTFVQFPQQAKMFEQSLIKKINAKSLSQLATQPLKTYMDQRDKYVIVACELYWAPCIDKVYQIDEYLQENVVKHSKGTEPKNRVQVYFFDVQYNNVYHRQFWHKLKFGYDIFGLFFKDPRAIRRWEEMDNARGYETPLDESDSLVGNPDESKLLDRHMNFTMSDFDYFK